MWNDVARRDTRGKKFEEYKDACCFQHQIDKDIKRKTKKDKPKLEGVPKHISFQEDQMIVLSPKSN